MAEIEVTGAYHLSNNKELYEPARSNSFEFLVPLSNKSKLLRAGYKGQESNAYFDSTENAEEYLRLSVVSVTVPTFSQEPLTIRRGNSVMKAAGLPTFNSGNLVINDYIGADGKSILMAWQNLSYNVKTQKVGRMSDYKIDCTLLEFTPDFEVVNEWTLRGCWISGLNIPDFNQEDGGKRQITATIEYDDAYMTHLYNDADIER